MRNLLTNPHPQIINDLCLNYEDPKHHEYPNQIFHKKIVLLFLVPTKIEKAYLA
jgi:hypothetical protein